jgi:hypothetical protein
MAPRILIFSIAMGADYSFEVKNIEIWVPAFFKHNNSSVATVGYTWLSYSPRNIGKATGGPSMMWFFDTCCRGSRCQLSRR